MNSIMNSCLIIGSGPSKKLLDMNKSYDVDCIVCIHEPFHKDTDAVITLDIRGFEYKEKKAVTVGIPIILGRTGTNPVFAKTLPPSTRIFDNKIQSNSGAMAVEWAITQGYTTIYTAGIDLMDGYINLVPVEILNEFINNSKVKLFRADPMSRLAGGIALPPERLY